MYPIGLVVGLLWLRVVALRTHPPEGRGQRAEAERKLAWLDNAAIVLATLVTLLAAAFVPLDLPQGPIGSDGPLHPSPGPIGPDPIPNPAPRGSPAFLADLEESSIGQQPSGGLTRGYLYWEDDKSSGPRRIGRDRTFEKILGFHPPGLHPETGESLPPAEVTWKVPSGAIRFRTHMGLAPKSACVTGDVVFVVKIDGVERKRTSEMRIGEIDEADLQIDSNNFLTLIVEKSDEDDHCDTAAWGDPRFEFG